MAATNHSRRMGYRGHAKDMASQYGITFAVSSDHSSLMQAPPGEAEHIGVPRAMGEFELAGPWSVD
jgi:hypothetical protein